MKKTLLPIVLGAVACALPSVASASLLVGFHSFTDTTGEGFLDSTADENPFNLQASIANTSTFGASTSNGSNDTFYGPDNGTGVSGAPVNNGRLEQANGTKFTVTNTTGSAFALTSLLFDAGITSGNLPTGVTTSSLSLSYTIGTGPSQSLANNASMSPVSGTAPNENYADFVFDLGNVLLGVGETITFSWVATNNTRLDNIALIGTQLSAIPEPGSFIALGGLLGAGMFVRNRRRTVTA